MDKWYETTGHAAHLFPRWLLYVEIHYQIGVTIRPQQLASTIDDEKFYTRINLKQNVIDPYNRGGVTMVAWHFSNPVSKRGLNWVDSISLPAVKYIISGGEAHRKYKDILKGIGEWADTVKGSDGKSVPMIFRPYHEFDGGWFGGESPIAQRKNSLPFGVLPFHILEIA